MAKLLVIVCVGTAACYLWSLVRNVGDANDSMALVCIAVVTFFAGYGSQAWADQTFDK